MFMGLFQDPPFALDRSFPCVLEFVFQVLNLSPSAALALTDADSTAYSINLFILCFILL
jgi:hypothetical protein